MPTEEEVLRIKLRKIEALFAGAATTGEKAAAGAAAERIRARLADVGETEGAIEVKFTLGDPWSRRLFIALCRRYGLRPYRQSRMQRQSLVVKAPKSFIDAVLWPEFQEINAALLDYLAAVTDKVIREEVYGDAGEAEDAPASAAGRRARS